MIGKGWRWGGAAFCAALAAAMVAAQVFPRLDLAWLDSQMRFAAARRAPETPPDMVALVVDERTLAAIPEPLSLPHAELGAVLEALAAAGARAVAVDMVLPERSYDELLPGNDMRLLRGIVAMRHAGVLLLARTIDDTGLPRPIYPAFVSAAGPDGIGFALLPVDRDGVVRRFTVTLPAAGDQVPSFTTLLAQRLGIPVHDGWIDHSRRADPPTLSMAEVLGWIAAGDRARLAAAFSGKIVLIGVALPFLDRLQVPVGFAPAAEADLPGLYLHARVLDGLRRGTLLHDINPLALALAAAALAGACWLLAATPLAAALTLVAALAAIFASSMAALALGGRQPVAALCAAVTIAVLGRVWLETIAEVLAKRRLRGLFARYVSPDVLKALESGALDGLANVRTFVCVVFIDVRDFTSYSEQVGPEQVIARINRLFEMATQVIHAHGGTVKEFMGDGIMAFFGAPGPLANPAASAFDAAREVLRSMPQVNRELAAVGLPALAIGIGAACGVAVVGHIGAAERHAYGAIGDCVNVASRLEGLTKTLEMPLVVSAELAARLEDRDGLLALGTQALKGHRPIEVCGWRPEAYSPAKALS